MGSSDDAVFEVCFETTAEDCRNKLLSEIFLECCRIGGTLDKQSDQASSSALTHGATSYFSFNS